LIKGTLIKARAEVEQQGMHATVGDDGEVLFDCFVEWVTSE
jgi:hypothetical protein